MVCGLPVMREERRFVDVGARDAVAECCVRGNPRGAVATRDVEGEKYWCEGYP